ncbi:hypothetical protein HanLR1_Chr00c0078g0706451 [Helianthus annuus]|nr:hypothetical protein HanLR1_Chr00c0078g0706451 [Helianthus annuus]
MGNLDGDSSAVRNEKPATNNPPLSLVNQRPKLMFVIYAGVLLMMYNPMVQILRWKYQGRNETPFETQSFLIYTSVFAFLIAGLTSAFSLHYYLTNSTRKQSLSPLLYRIINVVFPVSAVVAHLSLVLILIID